MPTVVIYCGNQICWPFRLPVGTDRLLPRWPGVRMEMNVAGLLLMVPFILLTAFAPGGVVACAAIFGFGFATGVYDSNLYASLLDVVSPRYRAAAVGIFGCGGNVLGALGPGLIGLRRLLAR